MTAVGAPSSFYLNGRGTLCLRRLAELQESIVMRFPRATGGLSPIAAILVIVSGSEGLAICSGYSPLSEEETIRSELTGVEAAQASEVSCERTRVDGEWPDGRYKVTVAGQVVCVEKLDSCTTSVVADLDGNGLDDVSLYVPSRSMGMGLGSQLIVLSHYKPGAFRRLVIPAENFQWKDVFDIDGDGKREILSCILVGYGGHSYWVYYCHRLEGDRILELKEDVGFPRAIWFRKKANKRLVDSGLLASILRDGTPNGPEDEVTPTRLVMNRGNVTYPPSLQPSDPIPEVARISSEEIGRKMAMEKERRVAEATALIEGLTSKTDAKAFERGSQDLFRLLYTRHGASEAIAALLEDRLTSEDPVQREVATALLIHWYWYDSAPSSAWPPAFCRNLVSGFFPREPKGYFASENMASYFRCLFDLKENRPLKELRDAVTGPDERARFLAALILSEYLGETVDLDVSAALLVGLKDDEVSANSGPAFGAFLRLGPANLEAFLKTAPELDWQQAALLQCACARFGIDWSPPESILAEWCHGLTEEGLKAYKEEHGRGFDQDYAHAGLYLCPQGDHYLDNDDLYAICVSGPWSYAPGNLYDHKRLRDDGPRGNDMRKRERWLRGRILFLRTMDDHDSWQRAIFNGLEYWCR